MINVITRPSAGRSSARVEAGSFGSAAAAGLVEGGEGPWRGRVFGGYARSDGFTANRDFAMVQAAVEGERTLSQGRLRALYTFLDNRFGAQGFYGAYPSWEATAQHGLLLSGVLNQDAFAGHATKVDASWRRHHDGFLLYRDRPSVYRNLHTNDTLQVKLVSVLLQSGGTTLTGAAEASRDELASVRLARRFGARQAFDAYLQGDNLLDRRCEEIPGVPMPGRSFSAGLRWSPAGK